MAFARRYNIRPRLFSIRFTALKDWRSEIVNRFYRYSARIVKTRFKIQCNRNGFLGRFWTHAVYPLNERLWPCASNTTNPFLNYFCETFAHSSCLWSYPQSSDAKVDKNRKISRNFRNGISFLHRDIFIYTHTHSIYTTDIARAIIWKETFVIAKCHR